MELESKKIQLYLLPISSSLTLMYAVLDFVSKSSFNCKHLRSLQGKDIVLEEYYQNCMAGTSKLMRYSFIPELLSLGSIYTQKTCIISWE